MHKEIAFALVMIVFLVSGCTRNLSAEKASGLAVRASNQEAQRLYQVQPFSREDGHMGSAEGGLVWEALTSTGGHDMVAKVTFDEGGSVAGVEVRMLAHPSFEPSTNLEFLRDRDSEPGSRIPEVMPK